MTFARAKYAGVAPEAKSANHTASHTKMVRDIRLALGSEKDLVLWLNPISVHERWDPKTANVSFQRSGLPDGSADLVGILQLFGGDVGRVMFDSLAQSMGSQFALRMYPNGCVQVGRFFALEVKTGKGVLNEAQERWHVLVKAMGGFCAVVHSVEEAHQALRRAREGQYQ